METNYRSATNELDIESLKKKIDNLKDAIVNLEENGENEENNQNYRMIVKFIICLVIIVVGFPITICDLYYAYNDNSCVNEPADKLSINLFDYLAVCGWTTFCSLTLSIILIILKKKNQMIEHSLIELIINEIILKLVKIFLIIWNIFGAVIFWGLIKNSNCSNDVYNYVFVTLIIKLVISSYEILDTKNKST